MRDMSYNELWSLKFVSPDMDCAFNLILVLASPLSVLTLVVASINPIVRTNGGFIIIDIEHMFEPCTMYD